VDVKSGYLFETIPVWPKTWYVETEIEILNPFTELANVFHFTISGNYGTYGYRIPALFLKHGNKILFRSDKSGSLNGFSKDYALTQPFDVGTNFHVRIEQVYDLATSKYKIKAYMNRALFHEAVNPQAIVFQNVKVFACSEWYGSCNGRFVLHGFSYGPLLDASQF